MAEVVPIPAHVGGPGSHVDGPGREARGLGGKPHDLAWAALGQNTVDRAQDRLGPGPSGRAVVQPRHVEPEGQAQSPDADDRVLVATGLLRRAERVERLGQPFGHHAVEPPRQHRAPLGRAGQPVMGGHVVDGGAHGSEPDVEAVEEPVDVAHPGALHRLALRPEPVGQCPRETAFGAGAADDPGQDAF